MTREVVIVPAVYEHAFVLATTMRPEDVLECAACGMTPLEGALRPLEASELAGAALLDDVLGAMFGVIPSEPGRGLLWFLTSHVFGENPKPFVRASKQMVGALLERYDELVNIIDGRYTGALRLAAMLGAEFGSPVQVGGQAFVPFRIRRT